MGSKKGKKATNGSSGDNAHKKRVARRKSKRAQGSQWGVPPKHILKTGPRGLPAGHIARRTRENGARAYFAKLSAKKGIWGADGLPSAPSIVACFTPLDKNNRFFCGREPISNGV